MKFNDKKSILFVRSISGIILGLIAIDIIFLNHKYICQNRFAGLIASIAGIMVYYKIDFTKKSFKERLLMVSPLLILSAISFFFW
ncbi:hypothetical protein [Clostridium beijerinckii]|uniref:hypothetical protein n=1 Tax=Clostridium beijerinckii TaxID=1520 RepID=UPI00098CBE0F|nr:hypothetical protein [Clostridium beijerinckii]NRT80515.1 hypothetical protein [Clostridium beijerinckii]OOM36037.1 hypothetical protein CBEIJ_51920 [Clostridium beijerinckii]